MNILMLSDLVAYSGVGQYMIQLGNELLKHTEVDAVVLASPVFFRNDVGGGASLRKSKLQILLAIRQNFIK